MKARLRNVIDGNTNYQCLQFCCPGCAEMHSNSGLHMIPVNTDKKSPSWSWDGNLESPTLSPSILTTSGNHEGKTQCHSYLRNGIFEFLSDCTHSLVNQQVSMPDLPEWIVDAT